MSEQTAIPDAVKANPFAGLYVSFSPANLLKLAPFIPSSDIRYYLCGLRVVPAEEGVILIATNGHVLAAVHDKTGTMVGGRDGVTLKVTPGLLTAARAAGSRSQKYMPAVRVLVRGSRLLLAPDFQHEGTNLETFVQPGECHIEGRWPDWRKVLPDFSRLKRGGVLKPDGGDTGGRVAVGYMAAFARVVAAARLHVMSPMVLWHIEGQGQVYVQLPEVPEFFAVVMPQRGEVDDAERARLPLAVSVPMEAKAAAMAEAPT